MNPKPEPLDPQKPEITATTGGMILEAKNEAKKRENQHTTVGIHVWSPTTLLTNRRVA